MRKYYQANTCISVNIVLRNKKNAHVAFSSLSNGKSVYSTSNEEIQYGLEHHYRYGDLFRLTEAEEETEQAANSHPESTQAAPEPVRVAISDLSSAKEYLSDHFGISRTTLRRREDILAAAKAHNIEFEGI